ncbi:hypothetical protein ACFSJW_02145 [Flavobacterium artemisiae]|uniref:Uncharacterized protein n=1 Tax=Flavobacterium artemisiae TaxID=2126556 RepID=A0ABW4HKJ0_9FLAO
MHTTGLIFNPQRLLSSLSFAMTYKITEELLPDAHVVKLFKLLKVETGNSDKDEIFYMSSHTSSRIKVKNFLNSLQFSARDLSRTMQIIPIGLQDWNSSASN